MKNGEDLPEGSHHYYKLMFTLFIAASFILHIVFLNMLIAIMSDIFDKVTEKRQLRKRETELAKISDYVSLIEADEDVESKDEPEDHLTRHTLQLWSWMWECCTSYRKHDDEEKDKEQSEQKSVKKDIMYVI